MIGAADISQLAKYLEDVSKAGDADKIEEKHEAFMTGYETLMRGINTALGAEGSDPASGRGDEAMEFSPEDDDEIMEFAPEGEK